MEKESLNTFDKGLLLKDLCARLPYGVKAKYYGLEEERECCDMIEGIYPIDDEIVIGQYGLSVDKIKLYLFPISSMTEVQWKEITDIQIKESLKSIDSNNDYMPNPLFSIGDFKTLDWCYANHIDCRGLIDKGLALDATGKNIY